jgi:hypothetical protein
MTRDVAIQQERNEWAVNEAEIFATEVYDVIAVTEVIRPAAIVTEESARQILVELALADVLRGGVWASGPTRWDRYDRPWSFSGEPDGSRLVGTIEVAYGTPTRYDITIYRVTVTHHGELLGWNVTELCDDALQFGGLDLATCPRADLAPPPKPFRF